MTVTTGHSLERLNHSTFREIVSMLLCKEAAPGTLSHDLAELHANNREERERLWFNTLKRYESVRQFIQTWHLDIRSLIDMFTKGLSSQAKAEAKMVTDTVLALLTEQDNAKMFSRILGSLVAACYQDLKTPQGTSPSIRFGFKLCDFFLLLGAAKLAQALHHFDDTPTDWRTGLEKSKDRVEPISQEEFVALAMKLFPTHLKNALETGDVEIGELIGTGTYLQTHAFSVSNAYAEAHSLYNQSATSELVLQLLKPDAVSRARDAYEWTLEWLNFFGIDKRIGTMASIGLLPIISHYLDMLPEESNFLLSKRKAQIASKMATSIALSMTDNTSLLPNFIARPISVNVEFASAGVFELGETFRISRRMQGELFHELPTKTKEEKLCKFLTALASYIRKFYFLFSGGHFDHDGHGSNQRVTFTWNKKRDVLTISIGMYDELGICNPRQKMLFVNMLMDGIACALVYGHNPDKAIAESYYALCKKLNRSNEQLHAMLKTVVTTTDFQLTIDGHTGDGLVNANVFIAIVQALCNAPGFDPVIAREFLKRYQSLQFLLSPKKAKTQEEKDLLELELERKKRDYPIKTPASHEVTRQAQAMVAQLAFKTLTTLGLVSLQKPGPYRLTVTG